jgi:hypothetical protein
MQVKKVLARKDGYSLLLSILLALVTSTTLLQVSTSLANKLFGSEAGNDFSYMPVMSARQQYLLPIATLVISIVVIEVFLQLVDAIVKQPKGGKGKK